MTDQTTPALLDDLRRALQGRYDVERLLGAGGMGSVYLGRDVTLDRPVAIKVIAPEIAAARVVRERFLHEARTVARLRHPHIVAVYTAGEADGMLYFVMEYVRGESLRDLLERERRVDVGRGVAILRDLAGALAYAHAQGVVHRDVKPENVLLDEQGRALLTDFGVARALAPGDGRMTGTGFVLGSPRYMSPEQAAGERELDGRSDVYSLGLVGYEMFAGEPAITATSAPSILMKQLTETPTPISLRNDRVPPAVAEAIGRALEKSPDARWATAAEMAAALDGVPPAARPARPKTSTAGAAGPVAPRWRRAVAAALAAVLLLAPAAWYVARGGSGVPRGVDPRRSYLVTPFEVLSRDPQLEWLREGSVSMLSLNLAQWSDLTVVDYERSLDLLRDAGLENARRIGLEDARSLARRAGVWSVVTGQVSGIRDSLIVVARLYDVASGRKVDEAQQSVARTADPRPLYDALARSLLDIAGAPPITLALAKTTTSSIEAYRAYLEGVRALNRWQLAAADTLFRRATRADSTFALAYYRHALTLGWQNPGDSTQLALIRHATDHADRLPPRERELVSAYSDFITAFPFGARRPDSARTNALFASSQSKYAAIVRRDSTDAEAWYGLGDAYFHHLPNPVGTVANWSRSLRAFNRTLALDSTFYLAYSHKLQIYQRAGTAGSGIVLSGDSLLYLPTDSARRAFGARRIEQAQGEARRLAVRDARAWIEADPVPQAYIGLAALHATAGRFDSAAAVIQEALSRPATRTLRFRYVLATLQARVDPPAALQTLRAALRDVGPAELRADGGSPPELYGTVLGSGDAAAVAGSVRDLNGVTRVATALESPVPGIGVVGERGGQTRWWNAGAQLAMGMPPRPLLAVVDSGIALIESLPQATAAPVRPAAINVPYLAYMATRNPKYLAVVRRWRGERQAPFHELDAIEALAAGDTAKVLEAVRRFPSPDSVRAAGGTISPMRWVARAEVFEALGDARRALAMYELLDPTRFAWIGPPEPGWPLYARSFLARGRLYEQLGEREKAAAAYERFLELWKEADPALQAQLGEAREGLARVRDAARATAAPAVRK
jgi:serine/threonine-protein kinase